jgi:GNAT superfamily N-acetyltransferase
MREGLRQLSERTRYQRFLAPKPEFSPDELRFLTEVDGEAHFALAALATRSCSMVGVGRFFRATVAAPEAEVALVVADPVQGKGLGRLLFARLCEAALERGVRRFTGLMLDENRAMRGLLRKLGGRIGLASYGVCEIELQLG